MLETSELIVVWSSTPYLYQTHSSTNSNTEFLNTHLTLKCNMPLQLQIDSSYQILLSWLFQVMQWLMGLSVAYSMDHSRYLNHI
jgi:hypothetical protein